MQTKQNPIFCSYLCDTIGSTEVFICLFVRSQQFIKTKTKTTKQKQKTNEQEL